MIEVAALLNRRRKELDRLNGAHRKGATAWVPVFGKRSCSDNKLERDDDSKKSHPALVVRRTRPKRSVENTPHYHDGQDGGI